MFGGVTTISFLQAAVLLHGAALNQDGRSSSLTAPSGPAQQSLIRSALHAAHMPPSRVSAALPCLNVMQQFIPALQKDLAPADS